MQIRRTTIARAAFAIALSVAACDVQKPGTDEAGREYFEYLRLSKNGATAQEQLAHLDSCVRALPNAEECLDARANLWRSEGHAAEALVDFNRALAVVERPYVRFERAEVLCALGRVPEALSDLNRAIAAQPDNLQFYPRRAFVHIALGEASAAAHDFERAGVRLAGYPLAALDLLRDRPAEAITELDAAIATEEKGIGRANDRDVANWRTLRMLAHHRQGARYEDSARLDAANLEQSRRVPEYGYEYWLTPRGCSNAYVATWARALVLAAQTSRSTARLVAATPLPTIALPLPPAEQLDARQTQLVTQQGEVLMAGRYVDDSALRGFVKKMRASGALTLCSDQPELQTLAPTIVISACTAPGCPDGRCPASQCQGGGPHEMESREIDIGAACTARAFLSGIGGLTAGQRIAPAAASVLPSDEHQGFEKWRYQFRGQQYSLSFAVGRSHGVSLGLLRDGHPVANLFELDSKDELSCSDSPWMGDLNGDGQIDVLFSCQLNIYVAWQGISLSDPANPGKRRLFLQRETGGAG